MGSKKNWVMQNYLKLGLYGDSLSMARPNVVKCEERYLFKLINYFAAKYPNLVTETIQRSKASIPVHELYSALYHDSVYYNWVGDICIFHFGIVDCAPRPVDTSLRDKIGHLPNFLKSRIIKYLHNNRRRILLNGKAKYVTSLSDFERTTTQLLELSDKWYKKIFVINICPTNPSTEFKSPGMSESIKKYNKIIEQQVKLQNSSKFILINLHDIVFKESNSIDNYIVKEDGHHITPLTHELIFKKILLELNE